MEIDKNERIEWLEMELERVRELVDMKQERIELMAAALNSGLKKQRDLRFELLKKDRYYQEQIAGYEMKLAELSNQNTLYNLNSSKKIKELEKELKNREDALDKLFKVAEEIFYGQKEN